MSIDIADTSDFSVDKPQPGVAEPASAHATPRTRWAAIIWGAVFAAIAVSGIWVLSSDARRDDVTDWATALTPNTIVTIALLAVGVVILIAGAIGLIRHTQRRRTSVR